MKTIARITIGIGFILFVFLPYTKAQTATINLSSENQYIRGFGGMNMPGWIADLTLDQVDKAFGNDPGEVGLSIMRIRVPYDTNAFNLEVPAASRAKSNGAIIMASPWSPPAAMKSNNNIVSGYLLPASYSAYATHLKKFCDYMQTNNASLYAISIQNEPDVSVSYESCDWSSTQMINFLTGYASGIGSTNIIVAESYNFNKGFTDLILNNSSAEAQVDIIGGHIYGGGLAEYPLARTKGKEVWMTEHLINEYGWTDALSTGKEIHDCMVSNYSAYIWWYVRRVYGPMNESGTITKRGYAMSQFAKFVRPGYIRVAATASPTANVYVTAYKNGSNVVIVALNTNTSSRSINFTIQNGSVSSVTKFTTSGSKNLINDGSIAVISGSFSSTLDAQSITTFTTDASHGGHQSNIPPVANAGANQEVSDDDNNGSETITLDGSASSDADGSITNYTWAEAGIQIASGQNPAIDMGIGTHNITLTVTDSDGATHSATVTITVNLGGGALEANIWLEAECGTVGSAWNRPSNASASNSQYVIIQAGNNNNDSPSASANNHITYTFGVSQSGTYTLWGRVIVPTPDDDSFWIRMDDGTWIKWNGISGGAAWGWDDVHNSDNGNAVMSYTLEPGSHTLTVANREDGAQLDKLFLTNTGTIPTGTGGAANNCNTNTPPLANAGTDQNVTDDDLNNTESVTLNGSGSSDPEGSIVFYKWTEGGILIATGLNPTVYFSIGVHTITLTVTDDDGALGTDMVTITVNEGIPNLPPVADAGPDQIVTDTDRNNSELITLDGSGSSDSDGTIASYVWSKSGIEIANGVDPIVSLATGTHNIILRVTDDKGGTDSDTVTIIINAPPRANAGPDESLTDADMSGSESVDLDGSGSSDADGVIVSYGWFESSSEIATGISPAVSLTVGTHTIALIVTDDDGLTDSDTLRVVVSAGSSTNQPPIADAGPNQLVSDTDLNGNELISLDGSGSTDSDGTIESYVWNDSGTEIATGVNPSVSLSAGTHVIALIVTDDDGATDSDVLTITVNDPPHANAGPDQVVTDNDYSNDEIVILDGSGSNDSDGTIELYSWSNQGVEIAAGVNPSVSLPSGVHIIVLTITDNDGATGSDTVTVVVNAPPIANAGADQRINDTDHSGGEMVALNGSGSSDSDGSIELYSWMEDNTEITTGVNPYLPLTIGVHTIVLKVTDNYGATDSDTLIVLVNDPPIAHAGADQVATDSNDNGSEPIILDASVSTDSDGTIESYIWKEDNTEITSGVNPTVSLTVGIHTIVLTVTDNEGATGTDTLRVIVNEYLDPSDLHFTQIPDDFDIAVYPNPFSSEATIEYTLQKKITITIELLDNSGRRIFTLIDGIQPEGKQKVILDGSGFESGIYYIRFVLGESCYTKQLMITR